MSKEQEKCYWRCLIVELQRVMTIAEIAEEVGVNDRQVWRWKEGGRPKGMNAIRVYLLHVKRCPEGHCPMGHVQVDGTLQNIVVKAPH
ncbi:MAG: hypothetical protein Q8P46_03795 [Hyphomicrobiales bacterium]|nr:hypothetical protein [Hyphomicrobiales bacterium]